MNRSQRREWRVRVFGHPELTLAHKLVLLALETYADYPEGTNARPGVTNLATMCGLGMRVVEGALQRGRRLGLIEQTGRANPKRGLAASYQLVSTRTTVQIEDASSCTSVRVEDAFQPAQDEFQPARNGHSTRTLVQPTNPITPIQSTEGVRGPYGPRCREHINNPNPPRCIPCQNARVAAEADDEAERQRRAYTKAAIERAIDNCNDCDQYGRLDNLSDCPKHPNFRQQAARS